MKKFLVMGILALLVAALIPAYTHAEEESPAFLFDDFNYKTSSDPQFNENGWTVRGGEGWPGVSGAVWDTDGLSFLDDPDQEGNRLAQMTSFTDGTLTHQVQFCHQRKYLEGTYASRVYFTDEPNLGDDGDQIVQTFYLISPFVKALDPDYSEIDIEYLPNGGWGLTDSTLFATTWETFRPEPEWLADNISEQATGSLAGWHTFVIQVYDGRVKFYVDGEWFGLHSGKYFPEVPMSINYNLWFIQGGQIENDDLREYIERIDWVYFEANAALDPAEIEAKVEALRTDEVTFNDSVPAWPTPLDGNDCAL